MKKFYIVIALLVIGAVTFVIASPKSGKTDTTASAPSAFAKIQTAVTKGALLYDVRTPSEYASGHFASATNFSLLDMQAGTLPEVAKSAQIYVYCHSGNRAGQAYTLLKSKGYTNVTDLGGLADVEAMGGELTTN